MAADTQPNRSSVKLGLPPGTPKYIGKKRATKTVTTISLYNKDTITTQTVETFEEIKQAIADYSGNIWINIQGLSNTQCIQQILEHFQVHPLAIEDVFNTEQRPKFEDYPDYLFIVLKMRSVANKSTLVNYEQISFIVFQNIVITVQEKRGDLFDPVRKRLDTKKSRIRENNIDFLTYALLDAIIDDYFNVIEMTGEKMDALEEELLANPSQEYSKKLYLLKREFTTLRKNILPLKDIISIILKQDIAIFSEKTDLYMRDLLDHCLRIVENTDTYRDILTGMYDIYLTSVSNKMNETMRILTIFATIFIPLTFLAGVYGMNFSYMPELKWHYGYYLTLGIMGLAAISLLTFFKRKKWI